MGWDGMGLGTRKGLLLCCSWTGPEEEAASAGAVRCGCGVDLKRRRELKRRERAGPGRARQDSTLASVEDIAIAVALY